MKLALVKPYSELRLNLGCGSDLRKGWVNVDLHGGAQVKLDLNSRNWPWEDNSVCEVSLHHVLEHLPDTVQVMKEIYRICQDGAKVEIKVPHPRHDDFLSDPTHVRPITIKLLRLFSKKQCELWAKSANTPLALMHNIDFELIDSFLNVDEYWMNKVKDGTMTERELQEAVLLYNNIASEIGATLKVCK